MALYLLHALTGDYAADARIRAAVDGREIWIVPSLNPDGAEYDVATGNYVLWRKNRQPPPRRPPRSAPTSTATGTSAGAAATARATIRLRRPTAARARSRPRRRGRCATSCSRAGSAARSRSRPRSTFTPTASSCCGLRLHVDDTAPGLDADQHATFVAIGQSMAASNGYTAQQSSDLYITDGSIDDWLWGAEGVFAYTLEMYPTAAVPGFYPPDEVIAAHTSRNREAVLRLLEIADCPYRAIGKQAVYCAAAELAATPHRRPSRRRPRHHATARRRPPPARLVSALASRVGVAADGRLRLRVNCRTTGTTRCRGTITLKARLPGGRGRNTTIARRPTPSPPAAGRSRCACASPPAERCGPAPRSPRRPPLATRQPSGAIRSRSRRVVLVRWR